MTDDSENASEPLYSRDQMEMLREENRSLRAKVLEHGDAARCAREEAVLTRQHADGALTDAWHTANERIIRAELRAAASQSGMIDLDGLKMADLSGVTLDGNGVVQGADTLMEGLRQSKPYLFGPAGARDTAPAAAPPRHASEMSREEFERELNKLIRR